MNHTNNTTGGYKGGSTQHARIITLIIYSLVFVLGIIGNGLVIHVTGFRMKRTVNSIWFLNLALADFLFTLFLLLTIISMAQKFNWPFGDFMCKLNSLVSALNMFASVFLLTVISLDRFLSTWLIVWTQNNRTPNKAKAVCLLVWLCAIICSTPFARNRGLFERGNITLCVTTVSEMKANLAIFRFTVGFLIPSFLIVCSYTAIGMKISRLQRERKVKPFRVILAVILAFFICWLPFHIHQLIFILGELSVKTVNVFKSMQSYILTLAYLNSCLNPILYVFMCDEFMTKLKQSLLLVFESAFAEERFFSVRHSTSSLHSLRNHRNKSEQDANTSNPLETKISSDE